MNALVELSANLPAHLMQGEAANSDLSSGVSSGGYPVVSYKGKVWHVVKGDERVLVANDEGDPRSSLEVVILKANPAVAKIYYPGGYEEGTAAKPTCYSNDGLAPALDAQEAQATKCAVCPHNAWGSRVSDNGSKGKACSDSRRTAIAPVNDIENPMLLRIPAGSLKELSAYAETLNRRRAPYQGVVTKVGFDHTVAHPKLTFKAVRWLDEREYALVKDVMEREVVLSIVSMGSVSAPTDADTPAGAPPAHISKLEPKAEAPAKVGPKPEPKSSSAFGSEGVVTSTHETLVQTTVLDNATKSLDDVLAMLDD